MVEKKSAREKEGEKKQKAEANLAANQTKEKVTEIFNLEKDGEEKTIETRPVTIKEEEKPVSAEQIKKESKIIRNIIIVIIGLALMFFAFYMVVNSTKYFEVGGVKFQIVQQGQLTLYQTSLPVTYQGKPMSYNFYLRTDPRTLQDRVPIVGNITFEKNMVLDVTTPDLFCGGDWSIGLANLQNMYGILGINLIVKNDSAVYEPASDYMFVTINKGNVTEIRQNLKSGFNNFYDVNIANCEVLPAFERLMLESFIRNKQLNP